MTSCGSKQVMPAVGRIARNADSNGGEARGSYHDRTRASCGGTRAAQCLYVSSNLVDPYHAKGDRVLKDAGCYQSRSSGKRTE